MGQVKEFVLKNGLMKVIGVFVVWCITAAPVMACEKLVLGWEEWEPYSYKNFDGMVTGLDIELIDMTMSKMGCKLDVTEMPWARVMKSLEEGGIDVAVGASYSDDRAQFAVFTDSYRLEEVTMMVRRAAMPRYQAFQTLEDLRGSAFLLNATRGYWYGEAFDRLRQDEAFSYNLQISTSDEIGFKKLLAGRVDGLLTDRFVGLAIARATSLQDKVTLHPMFIYQTDIHFMLSRQSGAADFVESFNATLRNMREAGDIDNVLRRYML